jgi:hypothetical protein
VRHAISLPLHYALHAPRAISSPPMLAQMYHAASPTASFAQIVIHAINATVYITGTEAVVKVVQALLVREEHPARSPPAVSIVAPHSATRLLLVAVNLPARYTLVFICLQSNTISNIIMLTTTYTSLILSLIRKHPLLFNQTESTPSHWPHR